MLSLTPKLLGALNDESQALVVPKPIDDGRGFVMTLPFPLVDRSSEFLQPFVKS